jgi:hypothetical protein
MQNILERNCLLSSARHWLMLWNTLCRLLKIAFFKEESIRENRMK